MRTGKILKEIIQEKGFKQKEIAEAAEISTGTLSDILNKRFIGKETTIKNIIEFLNLTKDEELEVWKAWSMDRAEPKAAAYFEKLDRENKKLKKILATIKEL